MSRALAHSRFAHLYFTGDIWKRMCKVVSRTSPVHNEYASSQACFIARQANGRPGESQYLRESQLYARMWSMGSRPLSIVGTRRLIAGSRSLVVPFSPASLSLANRARRPTKRIGDGLRYLLHRRRVYKSPHCIMPRRGRRTRARHCYFYLNDSRVSEYWWWWRRWRAESRTRDLFWLDGRDASNESSCEIFHSNIDSLRELE